MTHPHTITETRPAAVLDVVAQVVLGDSRPSLVRAVECRCGEEASPAGPAGGAGMSDVELVQELVGAAAANAQRLAIAHRLCLEDDRPGHLVRIMADAVMRGLASSASINVAAGLVGASAAGSEEQLVRLALQARSMLTDADLVGGAAALMLALTFDIARALALDPAEVEFELRRN